MKRILLTISMVALLSMGAAAQSGKSTNLGLKFGPNFNWVGSADKSIAQNNGAPIGMTVGGFIDHRINEHLAFSYGLNFNITPLKYQFTDYRELKDILVSTIVPNVNRRFRGTYLEVPLQLKIRAQFMDSWTAFATGGVGLGIRLSAMGKDTYEAYGVEYKDTEYVDHKDDYRLFQPALKFGLGAEYELNSNMSAFAQLTFHHALMNTFKKSFAEQTGSNLLINSLGIEVGLLF